MKKPVEPKRRPVGKKKDYKVELPYDLDCTLGELVDKYGRDAIINLEVSYDFHSLTVSYESENLEYEEDLRAEEKRYNRKLKLYKQNLERYNEWINEKVEAFQQKHSGLYLNRDQIIEIITKGI